MAPPIAGRSFAQSSDDVFRKGQLSSDRDSLPATQGLATQGIVRSPSSLKFAKDREQNQVVRPSAVTTNDFARLPATSFPLAGSVLVVAVLYAEEGPVHRRIADRPFVALGSKRDDELRAHVHEPRNRRIVQPR